MKEQIGGIIRTLPGYDEKAMRNFTSILKRLERHEEDFFYVAFAQKPVIVTAHIYLVIEGKIYVRLNLAGFEGADDKRCFDGTVRSPKYWAICTGPVSYPPQEIKQRGFQGFRYTHQLW